MAVMVETSVVLLFQQDLSSSIWQISVSEITSYIQSEHIFLNHISIGYALTLFWNYAY